MRDLVQPAETVVGPEADREAMSKLFLQHPVKYLYVVDAGYRYLGVVPLSALGTAPAETTAGALLSQAIQPITADSGLGEALQRFLDHLGERLPVIESAGNPVLLGIVAKSALLATYVRLSE
jgi:CIC family chloride channel protein